MRILFSIVTVILLLGEPTMANDLRQNAKPLSVPEAMRSQLIVVAQFQSLTSGSDTATYKVTRIFRCMVSKKFRPGDTITVRSDYSKHPYAESPPKAGTAELLFLHEAKPNSGIFVTLAGAFGRWPPNDGNIKLVEMSSSFFDSK